MEKDPSTGLFKSPQLLKRLESELHAAPMTSQTVMVLGVDAPKLLLSLPLRPETLRKWC